MQDVLIAKFKFNYRIQIRIDNKYQQIRIKRSPFFKDKVLSNQHVSLYQGFSTTNPIIEFFILAWPKTIGEPNNYEQKQLLKEKLESQLLNSCRLQVISEGQALIFDQNLQQDIKVKCLIMRKIEVYPIFFNGKMHPCDDFIIFGKTICFSVNNQVGFNAQGTIYLGHQTNRQNRKAYIQQLSTPYQDITQQKIIQLINNIIQIQKIDESWDIGYIKAPKPYAYKESLLAWVDKKYLIIKLLTRSQLQSLLDDQINNSSAITSQQDDSSELDSEIDDFDLQNQKAQKLQYHAFERQKDFQFGDYKFNLRNQIDSGSNSLVCSGLQTNNLNQIAETELNHEFKMTKHLEEKYTVKIKHIGQAQIQHKKLVTMNHLGQPQISDQEYEQNSTKLEFLVMEKMDGFLVKLRQQKLKKILAQNKKEGMKQVKKYFFQIILAYLRLYERNIAHIDLKPKNILVKKIEGGFEIKIADFGNSRHITSSLSKGKSGTEVYSPPWQNAKNQFTQKYDIFSLGGIFIYLILGKNPCQLKIIDFYTKQLDQVMLKQLLKDYDDQEKSTTNLLKKCLAYLQIHRLQFYQLLTHDYFKQEIRKHRQSLLIFKIGQILIKKGKKKQAFVFIEQAIQIEKLNKTKNFDLEKYLNNIGSDLQFKKKFQYALKCYKLLLKFLHQNQGKRSINTTRTIRKIGQVYQGLGDYTNALKCYLQYLNIQQQINGPQNFQTASILKKIGQILLNQHNYTQAKGYFTKCAKIQRYIQGKIATDTKQTIQKIITMSHRQNS